LENPFRANSARTIDFGKLAPRLSFVVDKKKLVAPIIGTPGNYERPVPRQERKMINALQRISIDGYFFITDKCNKKTTMIP